MFLVLFSLSGESGKIERIAFLSREIAIILFLSLFPFLCERERIENIISLSIFPLAKEGK
jgi:hypothetical protein